VAKCSGATTISSLPRAPIGLLKRLATETKLPAKDRSVRRSRSGTPLRGGPAGLAARLLDWVFARFRGGEFGEVTETVARLTGTPAPTLEAFAREHAAAFSA